MEVTVTPAGDVTIVTLDGELDASTAPAAQQKILPLAQTGAKIALDMSKVPYMSSAGIRMLLATYRRVTANAGKIVVVGVIDDVKDTMSVTGFLNFFQIADTLDQAQTLLAS